ncbi:hypothetical protein EV561_15415 [Rhizobium sp. BK376]|nr:hypothetical protein EV561_15415 [Rhizobium sp. BK376]
MARLSRSVSSDVGGQTIAAYRAERPNVAVSIHWPGAEGELATEALRRGRDGQRGVPVTPY